MQPWAVAAQMVSAGRVNMMELELVGLTTRAHVLHGNTATQGSTEDHSDRPV